MQVADRDTKFENDTCKIAFLLMSQ